MSMIAIPEHEITYSYSKSSGPGGQNVNKVASRVTLRWNVIASAALPGPWKKRFVERFHNRINEKGEIVIHSDRYRDQKRNQEDAHEKLIAMLEQVRLPPKKRIPTKRTKAKNQKRLEKKREQSEKKRTRQKINFD